MNAAQPVSTDPRELRPMLHQKIDAISDAAMGAVHDLLVEFERRWLFAQMAEDAEEDRMTGKHAATLVDQAIRAHRSRHPYAA